MTGKRSLFEKIILFIPSLILWGIWWTLAIVLLSVTIPISFLLPRKTYNGIVHFICGSLLFSMFIFPRHRGNKPADVPYPCIYTANHVSFFDLFISGVFLPGHPRGLELKEHFSYPVYGWFISRFGMIPIEPGSRADVRASLENAVNILKGNDRSLLIMPEGHRTKTGNVNPFKTGAFFLSRKSGIPVVPVIYKRLFNRNNRNSYIIRPGTVDIYLLDPVYPENFDSDASMAHHVEHLIQDKINE